MPQFEIDRGTFALFKVQMVRQIVDQNAIGIVGCMRPLLEHRAIADSKLRLNECS